MSDDVFVDDINISIMQRNQKLLIAKVKRLEKKEKEISVFLERITRELSTKQTDYGAEGLKMFNDLINKKRG